MKREAKQSHFWKGEWIGTDSYATCKHCGAVVFTGTPATGFANGLREMKKKDREGCKGVANA